MCVCNSNLYNDKVDCRYKAVQYNTMFHTALCWLKQNINQCQITNYHSGDLWGVICEDSVENWPRYDGTTVYGIMWVILHAYLYVLSQK